MELDYSEIGKRTNSADEEMNCHTNFNSKKYN